MAPDTAFYDQRAASYAAASHDMDLRPLYARFLPHVRPGGLIPDAGCGSGRDALAFRQAGFRVEAFDEAGKIGEGEHERFIIQNEKFLAKAQAKFGFLSPEGAVAGSFDLHPGAEKYYKEIGVL